MIVALALPLSVTTSGDEGALDVIVMVPVIGAVADAFIWAVQAVVMVQLAPPASVAPHVEVNPNPAPAAAILNPVSVVIVGLNKVMTFVGET